MTMQGYYEQLLPGLADNLPDDHSAHQWGLFRTMAAGAHHTGVENDMLAALNALDHPRKAEMLHIFAEVVAERSDPGDEA